MTKKEKIWQIKNKYPYLNSKEIAERIGCHDAYVRTVFHRGNLFKWKLDKKNDQKSI